MKERSGRFVTGNAPAPLLGQRFGDVAGITEDYDPYELNLSTGGEVYYDPYIFNNALTPTVSVNTKEGSAIRILLQPGASATLDVTNIGTKHISSDDFTVSKENELFVFCVPDGIDGALILRYLIKILN